MKKLSPLLYLLIFLFVDNRYLAAMDELADIKQTVEVIMHFTDVATLEKSDCRATIPIKRKVHVTNDLLDSTLRLLLQGVTENEKGKGLGDSFGFKSSNPLINYYIGVRVQGGTAIVNFQKGAMAYLDNTLCMQESVKAPIEKTLLEFSDIVAVKYAIDGKIIEEYEFDV